MKQGDFAFRDQRMVAKTVSSLFRNREIVWEMALRDLKGGSKGAVLGTLWVVVSPLIQMVAYVVIVSFIFKAKLRPDSGPLDYALYVLSGMIPWQLMTRAMNEAPMLIRANTEIVKQVVYPIETLPLNALLVALLGTLVNLVLLLVLLTFTGNLHWTLILIPIPFFFLTLFILGTSWVFCITGVLLKDLKEMVTVSLALLIYFSPVVLSKSMVGDVVWRWILWNPLSHVIIAFRDILWGSFHMGSWLIFIGMSIAVFLLGNRVIQKAKRLINEYI